MNRATKADRETEWQLQRRLTRKWARDGVTVDGERMFLAGWEVMLPSWELNDPSVRWNEPSLDFVFLDGNGTLVAAELKRDVGQPRGVWAVLAQVTHRAMVIRDSVSAPGLARMFEACHVRDVVKHPDGHAPRHDLAAAHQEFFGLSAPVDLSRAGARPIRRMVAAKRFGPAWSGIRGHFEAASPAELKSELESRYRVTRKANLELHRLANETRDWRGFVTPHVEQLIVD